MGGSSCVFHFSIKQNIFSTFSVPVKQRKECNLSTVLQLEILEIVETNCNFLYSFHVSTDLQLMLPNKAFKP